jgi:hypothetical protein
MNCTRVEGSGRRKQCTGICLERLTKITKNSVKYSVWNRTGYSRATDVIEQKVGRTQTAEMRFVVEDGLKDEGSQT